MSKTATAQKVADTPVARIVRPEPGPVFVPTGSDALIVRAGTVFYIGSINHVFDNDTPVMLHDLKVGGDYYIRLTNNVLQASYAETAELDDVLGGFHYAPGGNAAARAGGDESPAINPLSCWDLGYRPACPDPRGMTLVDGRFWCDIYLLGCNPFRDGSSRFGLTIADGIDLPMDETDETPYEALDYETSVKIFDALGKQLLGLEEFFVAAYGVTEGTSIGRDPKTTKLDAPRTSKWGVIQATGNMSTWVHNGDPDPAQRKCARVGGDWDDDEFAGSRYALVGYWPGLSHEWIGARGRSDHLTLDA